MMLECTIEKAWGPLYGVRTSTRYMIGEEPIIDEQVIIGYEKACRLALVAHRDCLAYLIDRYLMATEPEADQLRDQAAEHWPKLRSMLHEIAGSDEWHIPGCRRIMASAPALMGCCPTSAEGRFPALARAEALTTFCTEEIAAIHGAKAYLAPSIAA